MKIVLKAEGFEVDTFDSPQLALSSFKPDFIFKKRLPLSVIL
jgi:hypothetical protein